MSDRVLLGMEVIVTPGVAPTKHSPIVTGFVTMGLYLGGARLILCSRKRLKMRVASLPITHPARLRIWLPQGNGSSTLPVRTTKFQFNFGEAL